MTFIRAKLTINTQPLDNIHALLREYPSLLRETFQESVGRVEPRLLAALRQQPGPSKQPVEWTSKRQERFVKGFILEKDEKGRIKPYQRTGKLAAAWEGRIEDKGDTMLYNLQNPADAAPYVYGSLAQNRNQALRFKQKFHTNTGWLNATDVAYPLFDELQSDFRGSVAGIAEVYFARKATTRR